MQSPEKSARLPKIFPVGATYVVEGRGGKSGHLRVSSRYVVLPNGKRINIPAEPERRVAHQGTQRRQPGSRPGGGRLGRTPKEFFATAKKIVEPPGTRKEARR